MPVVEPVLSLEKLRQLLDEGHESTSLDYKSECDLDQLRDRLELAKDVAAMQIDGGYLVIGADSSGVPVRSVTDRESVLLDEANLRKILAKWLPEPFEIRSAIHEVEGFRLGLVYVAPNASGLCVIQNLGQHDDKIVFQPGDVFVRHGSSSERWRQDDVDRIAGKMVASRKEDWRAEMRTELEQLAVGQSAQVVARGPSVGYTWQLDAGAFAEATLELLRTSDEIPIRRLLVEAPNDAQRLLTSGQSDDLETLLGRLTCVAALSITYKRSDALSEVVKALTRIYDLGFDARGMRQGGDPESLWLVVVEHILALGALAVRLEEWEAVRLLALTKGSGYDFAHYATLLRHGLTMASRANKFVTENEDGQRIEASLLSLAAQRVAAIPCLRPDVPEQDERILTSLCQFDALAAIVAIDQMGGAYSKGFYVNFARFYTNRTEPALVRLVTDAQMRSELFHGTDQELATAIKAIDDLARSEGFRFSGWWGFDDSKLQSFVQDNTPDGG